MPRRRQQLQTRQRRRRAVAKPAVTPWPLAYLYDPVLVYFLTAAMVAMLAGLLLAPLRRGIFF